MTGIMGLAASTDAPAISSETFLSASVARTPLITDELKIWTPEQSSLTNTMNLTSGVSVGVSLVFAIVFLPIGFNLDFDPVFLLVALHERLPVSALGGVSDFGGSAFANQELHGRGEER